MHMILHKKIVNNDKNVKTQVHLKVTVISFMHSRVVLNCYEYLLWNKQDILKKYIFYIYIYIYVCVLLSGQM